MLEPSQARGGPKPGPVEVGGAGGGAKEGAGAAATIAKGNIGKERVGRASLGSDAILLAGALITPEEEQLILFDRPSEGAAELVLVQNLPFACIGGGGIEEEVIGIE